MLGHAHHPSPWPRARCSASLIEYQRGRVQILEPRSPGVSAAPSMLSVLAKNSPTACSLLSSPCGKGRPFSGLSVLGKDCFSRLALTSQAASGPISRAVHRCRTASKSKCFLKHEGDREEGSLSLILLLCRAVSAPCLVAY